MQDLFSEIYNCYYQVVKTLIRDYNCIRERDLYTALSNMGFGESVFHLLPKLSNDAWQLYERHADTLYSKISSDFCVPLSHLQKCYLKAILLDEKIQLFFPKELLLALRHELSDVAPLFLPSDFYYYDRFAGQDDYENDLYQENFRALLSAIRNRQYTDIDYTSRHGRRVHHNYLPCRLEYSIKNNCFRLLCVKEFPTKAPELFILNVGRMNAVTVLDKHAATARDINKLIVSSYYKEPVRLLIRNERNALERAMLQFANYEKNTRRLDDNLYECLIYYNKSVETELLIEIFSFGPMLKVVDPKSFVNLIKERLGKQRRLTGR